MKKKLTSTFLKFKFLKFKSIKTSSWFLVFGVLALILVTIALISRRNEYKVMFWQGKVNLHWDNELNTWKTDSDGFSGAEVDKLAYCQKFYPKTIKVVPDKEERFDDWRDSGNIGKYSSIKMSYICKQK